MTSKITEGIIEALIEDMDEEQMVEEYRKSDDPLSMEIAEKHMVKRLICCECSNPLSKDEGNSVYYCVACGYEYEDGS